MIEKVLSKTAEELGLPKRSSFYGVDCWICGHRLYSGREKIHGIQEVETTNKIGRFQEICSVCFQVQMTLNSDSLHEGCNSVDPIVRMFLCEPDMKRIAVWEVLDHEPWLKQIQKLPKKLEALQK